MEIIIVCDCGVVTVVRLGERLICKKCGSTPQFRYVVGVRAIEYHEPGSYKFDGVRGEVKE